MLAEGEQILTNLSLVLALGVAAAMGVVIFASAIS